MTVLHSWSGQEENMPVEQDYKNNKLLKQDALWEIDEHLMNIDHHHHQHQVGDYNTYLYQHHQHQHQHQLPDSSSSSSGNGGGLQQLQQSSSEYHYENDSYNNNNNVKFNSSMVAPPMRRYSTGTRVPVTTTGGIHQSHRIPNGHVDVESKPVRRYGGDSDSLLASMSHPKPSHPLQPFRQYSSPDMVVDPHYGRGNSRDGQSEVSSNYWNPSNYQRSLDEGLMPVSPSSAGTNSSGGDYSVVANSSLPEGYATLGRTRKGGAKETTTDFVPLRKSSDSGLLHLFRSQGNGLHLINEPEFLAHSLALSSTGSVLGPSGSSSGAGRTGSNSGKSELRSSSSSSNLVGLQEKHNTLSKTVNTLPQRDIQVNQARAAYLKQSTPLSQTQPIPQTFTTHSAPVTPLSESFPGFTRQVSNNSGSSTPTSSNGGDIVPTRRQSINSKSPLHTISESIKSRVINHPKLGRSNSTPNILEELENDDDIDKDDYGFLSYRSFRTKNHPFKDQYESNSSPPSSAMHNKSQSTDEQVQTRTFSRKWKKSKLTQTKSAPTSTWKPQGHCTWSCLSGKRLVLTPAHLLQLTEFERIVLQKLAYSKLQTMGMGCPIVIPKDSQSKRSKSRMFSIKKRSTSSSGLLDNLKEKNKDSKDSSSSGSCIFGMTLTKVLVSDRENGHRCPCPLREHKDAPDFTRSERKWSTSSGCGLSTDSLSESDSRSTGSTLLDALSLSSMGGKMVDSSWKEIDQRLQPHTPHIPYIMHCCLKHLENYGLNVLGIFRIAPSKKRVKQLREEFDSGQEVELGEDVGPHDVGGLLKEFLRDLPDPLLTKDLYAPFLGTRKIKDDHKRLHALRLLVALLPTSHRDALFALLRFLHLVTQHSTPSTDDQGKPIQGNKMNTHNLATLFGPNILHKAKIGEYQVESPERAEHRNDIISVLQELIDSYIEIFELPNDVQDEIYRGVLESDPEALDILLRRKCHTQGVELEVELSSLNEESDSLSASLNSDSLRPRTQSDVSALPLDTSSSAEARFRPRTYNEAVAMQQKLQQQIIIQQQQNSLLLGDTPNKTTSLRPPDTQRTDNYVLGQDSNNKRQHFGDSPPNRGDLTPTTSSTSGHSTGNTGSSNPSRERPYAHLRRDRICSAKEESQQQKKSSVAKQAHRLSTPTDLSWRRDYHRGASPKPMTDKQLTGPNVHIKVTGETANERPTLLSSMKSMLSPRPARKREEQLGLTIHHSNSGNHLTVPSFSQQRTTTNNGKDNKHASNSSLSSGYFGGSSRSGTTSPVTPEPPLGQQQNKWYIDTPPETPPSSVAGGAPPNHIGTDINSVFDFSQESAGPSSQFQRTSSLHRPLGVVSQVQSSPPPHHGGGPHPPQLPQWQQQRWKHWEEVAKQRSDELKQQETLV